MGLAATQARFLGITARKSNIEYEGQQVNQQRTALAEEVNALYNKLIALELPVAPDTTEYYESNYSFSLDNTDDYDGDYIIKSYYQNDDGTYYLNTERTYTKNVAVGTKVNSSAISTSTDDTGKTTYTYTDTNSGEAYTLKASENSSSMVSLINSTYGNTFADDEQLYYYQDDDGITHYFGQTDLDNCASTSTISSYVSSSKEVTETKIFESATVTFDENNRFSSISATDPSTGTSLFSAADVDTTRTYDSEGYDAALRDYTMSKDEYDKKVADLNAQTESLQQEDKVLELRLDQIDTEQNELNTELEAVKQILDDNIENTFKTFA